MQRYVRKDRRIYAHSTCRACGSAYGVVPPATACAVSVCLACDSPQCSSNGLARGTCGICYVGLLSGWSGNDRACQYKGCGERAIARVDGANKYRCRAHLERGKWAGYVAARLEERARCWELVDVAPAVDSACR